MGKTTTAIVLSKKRIKQDGTYPVKLRVTHNRVQKFYGIDHSYTETDFNKIMCKNPRGKFKEYQTSLNDKEKEAIQIIKDLAKFSFPLFEKRFLSTRKDLNDVYSAFEAIIKELNSEGRIGTATSYECALNSLRKYKSKLLFTDITVAFLIKYEKWMLKEEGNCKTTISIYLRCLRALFNDAISDEIVKDSDYPFHRPTNKRGYKIPKGTNTKKALKLPDISLIFNYKPLDRSSEQKGIDYWLFSYLCNGMNISDMAHLKYENIKGDIIEFKRTKTANTNGQTVVIRVSLNDHIRAIIERWSNKPGLPEQYVFPILKHGISPKEQKKRIQQAVKLVNKQIKSLGKKLNIPDHEKLSSYWARHSFSTVLKRAGVSAEFISEALGHSNIKTTQNYLDSFEDDHMKEIASILTSFNKVKPELN